MTPLLSGGGGLLEPHTLDRADWAARFTDFRKDLTDLRARVDDGFAKVDREFAKVDRGFAEVRGRLDGTAAGLEQITGLLNTLISQQGGQPEDQ